MAVKYQYEVEDGCLHVVAEGALSSKEGLLAHIARMHERRMLEGVSKLLIDERRLHLHINFSGWEDVVNDLRELQKFMVDSPKTALVCGPAHYPLVQHVFAGATTLKIFEDEATAKEWLMQE